MEFKEVLEQRRSFRKFKPTEIPEDMIMEILELAQLAPSAGNLQAYKVQIIRSEDKKMKLKDATFTRTFTKQESIVSAPALFLVCADTEESGKIFKERGETLYAVQDATIFAAYLQLAIASKGLASVWVGSFNEDETRNALSLPANLRPLIMMPFGYPDGEPRPRERKGLGEITV
jgi:nitroreductase